MTAQEKRNQLVNSALTRKQKNQYSQDVNKRTLIEKGYGDCSGTTWYWYKKLFNMNIGTNTEAQINSKLGKRVNLTITNGIPDESKMRKGDLMYFRGTNNARTEGVGHVEMYIGNGQCFGHGSGIGGTVKNMRDYCRMRYNQKSTAKLKNKGLICVIRFIPDDVREEKPKDLTTVNDIVWELEHRGILTNKALWLKKLDEDENAYYLAKGCVNYIRHMGKIPSRTAPELESINDIVWELEHRGILTQKDYWLKKLKNDTNSYWLARKCCDYIRRAE